MTNEPWRIRIAEVFTNVFFVSAFSIGAILTLPLLLLGLFCDELQWHWRGTLWRGNPKAERWWWRHKF